MTKALKPVDPRHTQLREVLTRYWAAENPDMPALPWGPADAGALGTFLRANPTLTVKQIAVLLHHRLQSEDHPPGEPVYLWIKAITRYKAGPLNKYRQLKETPDGQPQPNRADLGNRHATGSAEAAIARLRGVAGDRDR